jgi:acetyl-CoA carboxylase carboxyltransferase component
MDVVAPVSARVVSLPFESGAEVEPGDVVAVLEVMKMEHPVVVATGGRIRQLFVAIGDTVEAGDRLMHVESDGSTAAQVTDPVDTSLLEEVVQRHRFTVDDARPEAVAARHRTGRRTARENLADLCYAFTEYGPLALAAQRSRRDLDDLIRRTPADGMIGGVGRVDTGTEGDDRAVVVSYDYTVLAGTQGFQNHRKKDRLFALAKEMDLPVVLFAEGGGGRPGDVDWPGVSLLEVPAFRLFAEIAAPKIGLNTGYCFAGNAALLGQCDLIIATRDSNLGMGGPAMIEGGGLGSHPPEDVGPAEAQSANGVIDVLVDDDVTAVDMARRLLGVTRGVAPPGEYGGQDRLRALVPSDRRRVYDMRSVITTLLDADSFIELRSGYGRAAITGFGRIDGRSVGVIANDPGHLAGAIDHQAAVTLGRHLRLCARWDIPVVALCDTPGFMVGPEAEAEGLVRSAGELFRVSGETNVPIGVIVTRRAYGLGAMAMAGGGFHEPRFVVGWPTSEFGPMGLEGAVKLGFRRELAAIDDPAERESELERRIDEMYRLGKGVNVASHFEIDDVIDPADSRDWILSTLW